MTSSRGALVLLLFCSACSAALQFHECNVNSDCHGSDGGVRLYCTSDHMCVDALPDEQLCTRLVPPPGQPVGPNPLVIASFSHVLSSGVTNKFVTDADELAVTQLTDLGYDIVHYDCDDGNLPAQAARAFIYAVQTLHAVAAIGPTTSDPLLKGVAPLVKRYGAVVVSPSATAPAITTLDDDGLIWRTCASDTLQAKVQAQLVPLAPPVKLDVVYVDSEVYAAGLETAFSADYQGPISKTIAFATGDVATAVAQMDAPDYAVIYAVADLPPLMLALQSAPGQESTHYLLPDGARLPYIWGTGSTRLGWPLLSRITGTAPAVPADPDPSAGVFRAYASELQAQFNEDAYQFSIAANGYDAVYVVALAALAAGPNPTGRQIAANMRRLSGAGAPTFAVGVNDFGRAIAVLQSSPTAQINIYGASGSLDFDPKTGDLISAPTEVWKIVPDSSGNPMFATDKVVNP